MTGTILRNKHNQSKWSTKKKKKTTKKNKKKVKLKVTVVGKKGKKEEEGMIFLLLCLNHENFTYLHNQISNIIYIFIL